MARWPRVVRCRTATWEPPVEREEPWSISIGFTPAGPRVRMIEHEVPAVTPLRCTSYVTSGLGELGHPELVLTLRTDRRTDRGGRHRIDPGLLGDVARSSRIGCVKRGW